MTQLELITAAKRATSKMPWEEIAAEPLEGEALEGSRNGLVRTAVRYRREIACELAATMGAVEAVKKADELLAALGIIEV